MMENNYGDFPLSLSLRNKHGRLYVLILFNLPCLPDRGLHIFIGRWCHLCILPYSSVSRTARWISVEYSGVGSLTRKPPQGCYIRFLMIFLLIPWMSWQFSWQGWGPFFSVRFDPSSSRSELGTARFWLICLHAINVPGYASLIAW